MERGDVVFDFQLPDRAGTAWRLARALAAGPVVLFFYPTAMTRMHQRGVPLP
jgi:thioredoxin-dependent peroxiredoxin